MTTAAPHTSEIYPPRQTNNELNRLIEQARFYEILTEQVLELAGVREGMHVLDAGCGTGDVAFLAARMVGPTGAVIGVDRSLEAIQLAEQRAAAARLGNVRFQVADLNAADLDGLVVDEPVDALVGRAILTFTPEPAAVLRHMTEFVKPGGIVAFQEMDVDGAKSEPRSALVDTMFERIGQALVSVGADPRTGLKLHRIFQEAGLSAPQMILGGRVGYGPNAYIYEQIADAAQSLLPIMERTGVATAEEVDTETLADRLRDEVVALNALVVGTPLIGAWARAGG